MKCKLNPDFRLFITFIVIACGIFLLLCGLWFGVVGILHCVLSKFHLMEFCSSLVAYEHSFVFNTLDDLYWKCAELLLASAVISLVILTILIGTVFLMRDSYKQQKQYLQWKKKKSKWYNVLLSYIVVCD